MTNEAHTRENRDFWYSLVAGDVEEAQATVRNLAFIVPLVSTLVNNGTEAIKGESTVDYVA